MADEKRIDLTYLRDLAMGDNQLMEEMIEMFLENTPLMLKEIDKFIEEEKWDELATLAHKHKPNMDYMGMKESKKILIEIEEEAKNVQNKKEMTEKLEMLTSHSEQAYKELRTVLDNLS